MIKKKKSFQWLNVEEKLVFWFFFFLKSFSVLDYNSYGVE